MLSEFSTGSEMRAIRATLISKMTRRLKAAFSSSRSRISARVAEPRIWGAGSYESMQERM